MDPTQDQMETLKYIQKIEAKGKEISTNRQQTISLDMRRNNDRVGMRAVQKTKDKKVWMNVGPILIKLPSKKVEELLVQDQKECDIEINKLRSDLRIKVNELRQLEYTAAVPGLMLNPMTSAEMKAVNQIIGKSL